MRIVGPIFAIDLGQRAGFCVGAPGDRPSVGFVELKGKRDPRRAAEGNLIAFLQEKFAQRCPSLVVVTPPATLRAHFNMPGGGNEDISRMQYGLQAILEGMCDRFGLPLVEIHEATVRKHFIGKGRLGDRESTKRAVISRCIVLGVLPRGCEDDDQADAVALWDWACATYGRRSSTELFLYGEGVATGREIASGKRSGVVC